jgi:hypothetical protein
MPIKIQTPSGTIFSIDWSIWKPTESAVLTFMALLL